jgi:membrane protein DedA with SNARE-associated domain
MAHIALIYYLTLALLSILQGPIALLVGAGAAAAGVINPWWLFLTITLGNLSVDILWFWIGRLGKIDWLLKFRFLKLKMETILRLEKSLDAQAPRIVILAKLSSVFVLPVMVAAGLMRLPWKRWFPTLFGIEILKNVVLILAGYYSVLSITQFKSWLSILTIAGLVLSLLIPWFFIRRSIHLDRD